MSMREWLMAVLLEEAAAMRDAAIERAEEEYEERRLAIQSEIEAEESAVDDYDMDYGFDPAPHDDAGPR
jgi:hypothetical protein